MHLEVVSSLWEGATYPLLGNTTEKLLQKSGLLFVLRENPQM